MSRMKRHLLVCCTSALLALIVSAPVSAGDVDVSKIIAELNRTRSVVGDHKSYPAIFDAYLDLDAPPIPMGQDFNHLVIHPGMAEWAAVSGWAESNPSLAEAILASLETTLFGMPYGEADIESRFREAGLYAEIGRNDDLSLVSFPYLDAIDTISAYACAESYRRLEAGEIQAGYDLAMAHIFFLRQCCDREFLDEQFYSINLLGEFLDNLRDMFWVYMDETPGEVFADMAMKRLPFIQVDRSRLFMAEGDRIVAEALLTQVFNDDGFPDPDRFVETFSGLQAEEEPMTRFGAARRWRVIADLHDSLESSVERLSLVYDDWWRRWRVQEYDPVLVVATQYARTNRIRHAAVLYTLRNIDDLFPARNVLFVKVEGTALAAGLCGYRRSKGTWPRDLLPTYSVTARKRSNRDIFDVRFGPFKYDLAGSDTTIDTAWGRLHLDLNEAILWSLGQNLEDDRAAEHSDDGLQGDIVLWPPAKALLREAGLME